MKNEDLYVYKKSDFYEDFISSQKEYYEREQVDTLIAEKDAEIARLKVRSLDVKDVAHVLKAFKFYLCQLTHCAYDERTAQWIIDNWEQDYKRIEADK